MELLKRLEAALKGMGDWEQEMEEEELSEDIEDVLKEEQKPLPPAIPQRKPRPKRQDPVDLLLNPKYQEYLRDNRHKLPRDGGYETKRFFEDILVLLSRVQSTISAVVSAVDTSVQIEINDAAKNLQMVIDGVKEQMMFADAPDEVDPGELDD